MKMKLILSLMVSLALAGIPAGADEIPAHRAKQIYEAAPAAARVEAREPRRVLIWITPDHLMEKDPHRGYCIPFGTAAFKALGEKTGAFEPVVSGDLAMYLPENLRRFDAIVMNNSSGPWITPTDADMSREIFQKHGADKEAVEEVLRRSLLDYLAQGGGVVAIHYAIGANRHWPQFEELLGARFTGHPWNEEVGLTVEEPDHPLVAAFGGRDFRLADEIYQFGGPYDRSKVRVLISLDTERTNMEVKWINRPDNDFPLAWVKSHGEGRVFYTAFGHRTELYWHPQLLQFFLDAIQFAAGDLEAPASPRPDRFKPAPEPASPGVRAKETPSQQTAEPAGESEEDFVSLFNGEDLTGWKGDPRIWSVRDGAITGQTTPEIRVTENEFLIWQGGQPRDFELRLKFKLIGGNSGIYFHSEKRPPGAKGEPLVGPQADFSADHRWTGVLMEYTKRDILAERGQRVLIDEAGRKEVTGSLGDPEELLKAVRDEDWNDYTVIARDGRVVLKINDVVMCEVIDKDPRRTPSGYLALQVHTGPPMTVQFKDIRIRQHPKSETNNTGRGF